MELRDFAEQVLMATTLEEKLSCPANITDENPGVAMAAPEAPGRPAELLFKPQGTGKGEFPGVHRLEQREERGKLLHFFANHELLATELMALVLLRFPEAPPAFRRGVLQTLKDEQEHTRMYIARMKECGIHFGELPVSGYFWRSVSVMENPMDYVASLSLTFEQANLDFARHFSQSFAQVGDDETAKLLEKIYRDEIGHVAYGLKWFRRWKNPNESDWEAFCRQLKFPLSPQRAKGFALNMEGRRAAGLDAAFIAELNVYSHSKGRTPTVCLFNPFAEGYIAQGRAFNLTKHQAQLQSDLENLPQFLCRQDDIVLVRRRPSVEFLSGIKQAGFDLPEFVELGENGSVPKALSERKLGRLRPWAWSPDSMEILQPCFGTLTAEKRTADGSFNPGIAALYSKAWSASLLGKVLSSRKELGASSWLCAEEDVGVAVNTLDQAMAAIETIRRRGQHRVVLKQALGLAGGNAIRLFEPEILETQRRWMEGSLKNRGQLVVEPWLDRAQDFSVQLEMTETELKLCGFTGLMVDANGQFLGNWASPHFEKRVPTMVTNGLDGPADKVRQVQSLYADIFARLEMELRSVNYVGPVGLDAFVCRDAEGHGRLKPIVEINPRFTMGRVLVELMKQTLPGSHGLFRLVSRKMAKAEGCDDFVGYSKSLAEHFPLQLEGEPAARVKEGAVCLNDPVQAQAALAVFRVGKSLEALDVKF